MKAELYLVIKGKEKRYGSGWELSTQRVGKKKLATGPDEVLIKLNLDIPDILFSRPALVADIALPEPTREMVNAQVADEISNLVQEQMGIKLHISLESEDEV